MTNGANIKKHNFIPLIIYFAIFNPPTINNLKNLVCSKSKMAMHQNIEGGHNIALSHLLLCIKEGCGLLLCLVASTVRGTSPNWPCLGSTKRLMLFDATWIRVLFALIPLSVLQVNRIAST